MGSALFLGAIWLAISFVKCDLGLNFAIQGVPNSVNRAIGMGVQPVVAANMSISLNETLDSSGVLGILRSIGKDVVTPLDLLLAGISSAASDKSGDPSTLFGKLDSLMQSSAMALKNAETTASDLQPLINPSEYNILSGNLTQLSTEVMLLATAQNELASALNVAIMANPPYTTRNISTVITPSLIADYTTPLRNISNIMSILGTVISSVAKDKQAAIKQQINLNETVNMSLKNLIQVVTNLNRTNYGVYNSVIRASDNSLKAINQSYAMVLSKASTYNNGNMTNLTNFLANTSTVASGVLADILNNTTSFTLNLAYALGNQTTNISQSIYNGARNISDTASTSDSIYARSCERKYAAMFQQPGLSPSRINVCLQSEMAGLSNFAQLMVPALFADVLRWVGPQVVRINMCGVANGTCSMASFNAFTDFSSRLAMKYDVMSRTVLAEQNLVLYRVTKCVDTVTNDIQDMATSIQNKFIKCLTTGS